MHASTLSRTHTYIRIVSSFLSFLSLGNTPLHLAVTMGHQGELGHAERLFANWLHLMEFDQFDAQLNDRSLLSPCWYSVRCLGPGLVRTPG